MERDVHRSNFYADADANSIDLLRRRRRRPCVSASKNATLSSGFHLASASTFSAAFTVAR